MKYHFKITIFSVQYVISVYRMPCSAVASSKDSSEETAEDSSRPSRSADKRKRRHDRRGLTYDDFDYVYVLV